VSRLPPELPGGLPWLGHALAFRRDPVRLLEGGRARFGDVFAFRLPGTHVTALTGPRAQGAFFQAPEDQLSVREVYQFTVPIFGKGVVYDVPPVLMSEQIGFLVTALRDERLRAYARVMEQEAEAYVSEWGDAGEVDLLVAMNELTVFIASRCLVGAGFRQAVSKEFARLYHDLEGGITLAAFVNPYLPLPSLRRRDRARRQVAELIGRLIAERRGRAGEHEDFLQTLLVARYADGRPLDDDVITGLLLATVFAGQHTSATLGAWTGIELLRHPGELARVRAEQEAIVGEGAAMSLESLRRLEVLERCIKETERMHPPLILLMRKILRDFGYEGYVAPAGGLALVSPAVSHRIAEVFPDPERYDPDRYQRGRQEDRKASYALIGFGGGAHRCIGSIFAYQQVKVIWSVLLRRFDLELVHPDARPDYSTFVVGPRPPSRLRYRRRPGAPTAPGQGAGVAVGARP
jgi:sterol 14alpha-demethylase